MGNPFSKDGGTLSRIVGQQENGGERIRNAQAAIGGFDVFGQSDLPFTRNVFHNPYSPFNPFREILNLETTFDELELSDGKKIEAVAATHSGNFEQAAHLLLQAGSEKIADNSREFSGEAGGRRSLKSVHGTFLRAHDSEWKVDMVPTRQAWENWYIEDWGGKVVFKAIHTPGRFLRAHPDGGVDLVDRPQDWETWKPFKNNDGSWSFLSVHGRWLSARQDGSVCSVNDCDAWEHFWLEWW